VITAPDLDDTETRALAHARAVTYLDAPGYGEMLVELNGWEPGVLKQLRDHDQFKAMPTAVSDLSFHRTELLGPASLVPDEWMQESCALGSVKECVESLLRFRAAGADEIVTYGSTPNQNAALAETATVTTTATPTATSECSIAGPSDASLQAARRFDNVGLDGRPTASSLNSESGLSAVETRKTNG